MKNSVMGARSQNFDGIEHYGVEMPSRKAVYGFLIVVLLVILVAAPIFFCNQMLGGDSKF